MGGIFLKDSLNKVLQNDPEFVEYLIKNDTIEENRELTEELDSILKEYEEIPSYLRRSEMILHCKKCGYEEVVNKELFMKVLGGAVSGFGFWAWVSFLFAGTGFALAICVAIVLGGVGIAAYSTEIAEWFCKKYDCPNPNCGARDWECRKTQEEQKDPELMAAQMQQEEMAKLKQENEQLKEILRLREENERLKREAANEKQ